MSLLSENILISYLLFPLISINRCIDLEYLGDLHGILEVSNHGQGWAWRKERCKDWAYYQMIDEAAEENSPLVPLSFGSIWMQRVRGESWGKAKPWVMGSKCFTQMTATTVVTLAIKGSRKFSIDTDGPSVPRRLKACLLTVLQMLEEGQGQQGTAVAYLGASGNSLFSE